VLCGRNIFCLRPAVGGVSVGVQQKRDVVVRIRVLDLKNNLSIRIECLSSSFFEVLPSGEMHLISAGLEFLPAQEVRSSPIIICDSEMQTLNFLFMKSVASLPALQFGPHLLSPHPVH